MGWRGQGKLPTLTGLLLGVSMEGKNHLEPRKRQNGGCWRLWSHARVCLNRSKSLWLILPSAETFGKSTMVGTVYLINESERIQLDEVIGFHSLVEMLNLCPGVSPYWKLSLTSHLRVWLRHSFPDRVYPWILFKAAFKNLCRFSHYWIKTRILMYICW